MKNENIIILKKLLVEKKNIVIIPHTNPDGDAIGSCLALLNILNGNYSPTIGCVEVNGIDLHKDKKEL